MKIALLSAAILFSIVGFVRADAKAPGSKEIATIQRVMKAIGELQYQTGEIKLIGGKAAVKLTDDFRYLDSANARKVLVDIWGNPPEVASTEGMIVPKGINYLDASGWAAIIKWKDEGYVKDSEFETIDFNKMLEQLKEGAAAASQERVRRGYGKMELAGWATPPRYDRQNHKLYWAKAFNVDGPMQQLNYDIRILGRAGFFELSILAGLPQLQEIETKAPSILAMVDFTDGNRYADYKAGSDKVAAYGIAGLIAGGVLAKAGFFKVAALFFAKFAKVIVVAVAAFFGAIAKLFGRKKAA